jgi:polyisoprenoid-binding protein YceI
LVLEEVSLTSLNVEFRRVLILCPFLVLLAVSLCSGQNIYEIDPARSKIEIRLKTSGFLSFLGDEHLIFGPIAQGRIIHYAEAVEKSFVEVEVKTDQIKVQDPDLDEEDRREVQQTMESERVLGVKQYPKISFKSSLIRRMDDGQLLIAGDLTLRGRTRRVTLRATIESTEPHLKASGRCRFKQTEFGIKPVTAGAGMVRVKDEIELTFQIHATPVQSQ